MAGQERQREGDADQRRKAAREARREGKSPSEVGATLGASKQTKRVGNEASHQEKMDTRGEGKRGAQGKGGPRPGNREHDPKRTDRWG